MQLLCQDFIGVTKHFIMYTVAITAYTVSEGLVLKIDTVLFLELSLKT